MILSSVNSKKKHLKTKKNIFDYKSINLFFNNKIIKRLDCFDF